MITINIGLRVEHGARVDPGFFLSYVLRQVHLIDLYVSRCSNVDFFAMRFILVGYIVIVCRCAMYLL